MPRFVIGVATLAVAIVALAVGSAGLQRRCMPELDGPPAVLAPVVVALSILVVSLEALGSVGLFATAPVVTLTCLGAVAGYCVRRASSAPREREEIRNHMVVPSEVVSWGPYAALFAVAVAVAAWSMRAVDSL